MRSVVAVIIGISLSAQAWAHDNPGTGEQECYDVKVSARAIEQVPSVIPDCGDNCIVGRWPWFVDLEIDRVLKGRSPGRRIRVLTFQHTYIDKGPRTWWLRHNTDGRFNARWYAENGVSRCAPDAKAAMPYIRPAEGETLDGLRRAGQHQFDGLPK